MIEFRDRYEAGRFLATKFQPYAGDPIVQVLALPRGGVPVGFEVAKALETPLDAFLVRKLGLPGQEELAIGAIATGAVVPGFFPNKRRRRSAPPRIVSGSLILVTLGVDLFTTSTVRFRSAILPEKVDGIIKSLVRQTLVV